MTDVETTDTAEDIPDLLSPEDFQKFKSKDEAWFLGAAGEAIRDECGWHIYPVISETNVPSEIGREGVIMLQSLNVVSVERLVWQGISLVPETDFIVHASGWIQLLGCGPTGGHGLSRPRGSQGAARAVLVDFTHGFPVMPKALAEVGYELAATTMERPSGVVDDLTAGPYRFKFGQRGANLTDEQKSRCGPYSVVRV